MVPSDSTTATNDNQIQIHATTTRISTTSVSDLAEIQLMTKHQTLIQ